MRRVIKTRVKALPASACPPRAGVILFSTTHDGGRETLWFGLGTDSQSHDLTDFGGGVSYTRMRETAVQGALRELKEETLGIFGTLEPSDVAECPALLDAAMLLIFVRVPVHPQAAAAAFQDSYARERREQPEVCSLQWVTLAELRDLISPPRTLRHAAPQLYHRLRDFLCAAGDFAALL